MGILSWIAVELESGRKASVSHKDTAKGGSFPRRQTEGARCWGSLALGVTSSGRGWDQTLASAQNKPGLLFTKSKLHVDVS